MAAASLALTVMMKQRAACVRAACVRAACARAMGARAAAAAHAEGTTITATATLVPLPAAQGLHRLLLRL